MSKDTTYLALPPDLLGPWAYQRGDSPLSWAKTEVEKQTLSGASELIIILAGENIRRFSLELPGLRGRELQAATEFELEDHMGGAVSDEVICQDRKRPGTVALMSQDLHRRIKKLMNDYGLIPLRVLIDYDLLGAGQAVHIGERLIKGGAQGYAVHEDWTDFIKDAPDFNHITPQDLFTAFKTGLHRDKTREDNPFDLKASLRLINSQSTAQWQTWAKLAALALGVIILPFMLNYYAEARAWTQQADEDKQAAAALYTQATGEPANDPARQISQRLKSGTSSAKFLDMSAVLISATANVDGVEIDKLRYDPRQNLLQLSLRYPNFEAGAALEQAVAQAGGRLVVGGIRERGEALIGEASLSLEGGGQ